MSVFPSAKETFCFFIISGVLIAFCLLQDLLVPACLARPNDGQDIYLLIGCVIWMHIQILLIVPQHACCCTFMGPELYFLDLELVGLRVIGKTNWGGGESAYIFDLSYLWRIAMAVRLAWLYFLARQGRGLRGSVGQESEKTVP
jgi:hypothetical protein